MNQNQGKGLQPIKALARILEAGYLLQKIFSFELLMAYLIVLLTDTFVYNLFQVTSINH
ncbi:MAG: hypothetical protein ABR985_07825 [Methanotrichaceae archaeon]|jgi:hypothetical protein